MKKELFKMFLNIKNLIYIHKAKINGCKQIQLDNLHEYISNFGN